MNSTGTYTALQKATPPLEPGAANLMFVLFCVGIVAGVLTLIWYLWKNRGKKWI